MVLEEILGKEMAPGPEEMEQLMELHVEVRQFFNNE